MKRCYIGIGGLGSKILSNFERKDDEQNKFIYIDAVPEDLEYLDVQNKYALTNQKNGCYHRIVGKDEIKVIIYNGAMPGFIDDFFLADDFELVFVTSTFGGFGSAVAFELSDFYSVKIKNYRLLNNVYSDFKCKVIAFPLQGFDFVRCIPKSLLEQYGMNEIEFINEFRNKEARNDKWYLDHSNCIPCVDLYVPVNKNDETPEDLIALSDDELRQRDVKDKYYYSAALKRDGYDVFISYSSKNQNIADKLVEAVSFNGLTCWIATTSIEAGSYAKQIVQGIRQSKVFVVIISADSIASPHVKNELDYATSRIKDGLIIMPFKIDCAELDDECRYYLGRQEFFRGETPPIEERIDSFVKNIKKVLEN